MSISNRWSIVLLIPVADYFIASNILEATLNYRLIFFPPRERGAVVACASGKAGFGENTPQS